MSIAVYVTLTAKPGAEEELAEVFRSVRDEVRKEPGNLYYSVFRSRREPGKLFVFEQYADKEALAAHQTYDHFKAAGKRTAGLTDGPMQFTVLEEL